MLKTRLFSRWMRKTELNDAILREAIGEMEQGLVDADLGGGLFKKRVALPGRGKSGSTRTLVATNRCSRWIFVFGFEKNERDNVSGSELDLLRKYAHKLLGLEDADITMLINRKELEEIFHEKKQ